MGTRRHQLDYTSSSDQSCDTVIYIGSDGCPVSDHELTDYERPPATTTGASAGSEQEGAGSRSKSVAFRSGLPRAVGGRHSDGELATSVRLPRRSLSTKPAWRSPPPPPPPSLSAKAGAEMWVDGPKSMSTRVEQWVDGPPEFRHADEDSGDVEMTSKSAEQRPCAIAKGDGFLAEIAEETERQSVVETRTDEFRLTTRSAEQTVVQMSLRAKQHDIDESKCTTKGSGPQFTVADVHQSAAADSEMSSAAKVLTSADKLDVGQTCTTPKDAEELPSIERRTAVGRTRLDIDALLLANRESIYELQMDDELETGSRESLLQLVCGSDDDWSTCGTEPRRSKCRQSDGFGDLDACLKDLNDMVVTASELPESKACVEERSSGRERTKEEPATNDVTSEHVWIRTQNVYDSPTSCVQLDCPDKDSAPTAVSSNTESAAVTIPTTNRTRQSAIPTPVSSCSSAVRRKPPPIPVRSSSVSQSADPPANDRTRSTNITGTSTSSIIDQKTLSDSKNGSASRGFCFKDCSAAREAEMTATCIAAAATTKQPRGDGADAKQPGQVPPPAPKCPSRIALPCRREKKNRHQPDVSTCNDCPLPAVGSPGAASREALSAVTPMSPYHTPTKRQTSRGADSEHSSSVLSGERPVSAGRLQTCMTGARRRHGTRSEVEASSGYESMMRDSEEVTGTSSASECQSPLRLNANKIFRKKGLLAGSGYF